MNPSGAAAEETATELERIRDALAGAEDPFALCFRAAQICLTLPGAAARAEALEHLRAAWRARPGDQDALVVLARCLREEGRARELADLYVEAAQAAGLADERAQLLLQAAELYQRDEQRDEALAACRGVLAIGERGLRGLRTRAARTMFELLQGAEAPAEEARTLALLLPDLEGREAFGCSLQLGALQQRTGELEASLSSYRLALSLQPGAPEALDPVRRYLREQERFEELADVLTTGAANAQSAADRAQLWREVAALCEATLKDLDRAAGAWWRAWENSTSSTAPTHLKRIYTEQEDWERYVKVLRREALCAADAVRKVEVYHERATLQREALGDDAGAVETYRLILQLKPDDVDALQALVAIHQQHEELDAATRALERCIRYTTDDPQRQSLLRRLARFGCEHALHEPMIRALRQLDPATEENRALALELWRACADRGAAALLHKLDALLLTTQPPAPVVLEIARGYEAARDWGRAADFYRHLLAREPAHAAAREALVAIDRALHPAEPPAPALARRAAELASEQPRQAVRLYVRAAQVAAHAGNAEAGREHLAAAVSLSDAASDAELRLLDTALREAAMHRELAELLDRAAQRAADEGQRKELLKSLAELARTELDDERAAATALQRALAIDPSDTALGHEVSALLQRLGDHAGRAEALEHLAAEAPDSAELLAALGETYAVHLADEAGALRSYGALLELVPDHAQALAFCRRHDTAHEDFQTLVVRLSRAAEAATEPLASAELHREIAQIAEERLSNLDFAIAHWRSVVEALPGDGAPRGELKRLLTLAGRNDQVEAVLLSEISRAIPEQKIPLYLELAELVATKLENHRGAAAYLRNALQLSPQNREVMARLAALYEEAGQWRDLAVILRRHADVEHILESKIRLLLRAARVLLGHLGRDEEAVAVCRRVRELRAGDRAAASLLGEVFVQRGDWRQLADLWREQIACESEPQELGRLHLEMGQLLLERLQDPEQAATHFEQALDLDAGKGEVLPLLRKIYATLGRWDLLTELIRGRVAAAGLSAVERARALCEIGKIREEQLEDLEGAWEAYEGALQLAPDLRPALSAMRALAVARGRWRDAVTLARRELGQTQDQLERARLLVQIAEMLQSQLERPSAAAEALEEARQNDPSNATVIERLATLYFEDANWQRAGQLLEQVVTSGVDLPDVHAYYYRLGYASERLGQEEQAFSYYVKSFGREPLYLPTLNRLVDLCYRRRQWDNTLRITEAIIDTYAAQKTPEELADLYVRYGACKLHLAQREVALRRLQELVIGPNQIPKTDSAAWEDVADNWAATLLEPRLLRQLDPAVVTQVIKAMEQALGRVRDHAGALQILAALTICRGDWDRSLRFLERAAESQPLERRTRALLLVCAADIAAYRLHALQRAEAYYRRALTVLPGLQLARQRLERLRAPASHQGRGAAPRSRPPAPPPAPPTPPVVTGPVRAPPPRSGPLHPVRRVLPPLPPLPGGDDDDEPPTPPPLPLPLRRKPS